MKLLFLKVWKNKPNSLHTKFNLIKTMKIFNVFLICPILFSCVEQKFQQVAVTSPKTNIGGGNVNGNQVNVVGNAGDIKTGDQSQINVGGNVNVVVNKPAPLIDSVNITGNDPRVFKVSFNFLLSDGMNSEISYTLPNNPSEKIFRGFNDLRLEIIGKNFDADKLQVYTELNLPIPGYNSNNVIQFKTNFEVLEKTDTRILAKFSSNIDFPKLSKDVLNERLNQSFLTPPLTAIPGDPIIDFLNQFRYKTPTYCFNEWGTGVIAADGIYIETISGRVSNPRSFGIYPEIQKNNFNNFIYNCFVYNEIRNLLQNQLSFELKSISYNNGRDINIPIPLPTTSSNDQNYLPLKYIRPTPTPTIAPTPAIARL